MTNQNDQVRYADQRQWKMGRGPNGRRVCRWCGTEVEPPRRTWCSEACVDEWLIRSSSSGMRRVVYKRDRGICAECGCDTEMLKRVLRHAQRVVGYQRMAELYDRLAFSPSRTYWEADHIVPVVRGGGGCGPENIRTLCRPCHLDATRKLAADRARERQDAKRGLLSLVEGEEASAR